MFREVWNLNFMNFSYTEFFTGVVIKKARPKWPGFEFLIKN